jgi:tetratricopeptide (TPR) repeat protein
MRLSSSLPRAALPSVFLWLTLLACGAPDPEAERPEALADEPPAAPAAAPLVSARPDAGVSLPRPPGALGPSHVEVHGSVPLSPDALAEFMRTEDCAACHQEIAASWASSAHARSSFDNPFYRASIERFRAARGEEASRFCAGCHDPALLLSGVIDQPTIPADERASAGIPCRLCHGVTEARADGNGSYVWSAEPIPLPDPADPVQVAAHRARVGTDVLRSTLLCGSCHRSFAGHEIGSPHHFNGIDDLGAFGTSAFGGAHGDSLEADVEPSTCRGCHMQREPATHDMAADNGSVPSHRFAGAHLSLTTDPAQHAAVRARLQDVVRIDIPAGSVDGRRRLPLEGSPARSGSRVTLDVVIRNLGVGHRFPGGTRDLQDTFVELRIVDAAGALVAEAGTQHAESGDDPTAFGLRAVPLDAQALPEELHDVHDFVVAGFDRSLAARDATVVRYEVTLPELSRAAWPLRVEALLRHRRHPMEFSRIACEASRTEAGQAFRALSPDGVDPCTPEPITDLARAVVFFGAGSTARAGEGGASAPLAERFFDHALGLSRELQEHLDDARASLDAAQRAMGAAGNPRRRAAIHLLRARVAGAQGRTDEALREAASAERLLPDHPATHRSRGRALAQVWRWPEAAAAFGEVVRLSPGDTIALREWTRALGSARQDEQAVLASRQGLARAPRDADMLRTQALSLPDGHAHAREAREASLTYRVPDEAPHMLRTCEEADPTCARDRLPVPRVVMRRP